MENKLSFNKRISLTKIEVFAAIQAQELDKTANKKSGYYSIKTIIGELNPIMNKYDVDLDLLISNEVVDIVWHDCLKDVFHRSSSIDISKIKDIPRLPSMTNDVQSMGACLTYVRRYAYTVALNLNATDHLENNTGKPIPEPTFEGLNQDQLNELEKHDQDIVKFVIKKSSYGIITNIPSLSFNTLLNNVKDLETKKAEKEKAEKAEKAKVGITKEPEKETPYVPNTKMLYTIATDAGVSKDNVHKYIKKNFGIESTKELTSIQFDLTIQDLEKQKAILERKVLAGADLPISPDNFAKPADEKKNR